jgi:hypothetical protein
MGPMLACKSVRNLVSGLELGRLNERRTLRSKRFSLLTRSASRGLLFALSFVYSSRSNTLLSLIVYMAAHCGCSPSAASKRVAVWNVESVDVRRGMCSSPYHSVHKTAQRVLILIVKLTYHGIQPQ